MCILIRRCGWKQLHVCLLSSILFSTSIKKEWNIIVTAMIIIYCEVKSSQKKYVPHLVVERVYLTEHFRGTKWLEF